MLCKYSRIPSIHLKHYSCLKSYYKKTFVLFIYLTFNKVCDIPSEDLLSHFPSVISFMTRGMEAGSVLVHCYHGKSRSATLVTAFLMAKYKMSVEKALSLLKSKRKNVNPNPGFMAQLRDGFNNKNLHLHTFLPFSNNVVFYLISFCFETLFPQTVGGHEM